MSGRTRELVVLVLIVAVVALVWLGLSKSWQSDGRDQGRRLIEETR